MLEIIPFGMVKAVPGTRMAMTGHTVKETEKIYNHDWGRFEKAIAAME